MKDDSSPYQTVRFAPLGVHYGLAHAALLKGRHSLAQRLIQPLLRTDPKRRSTGKTQAFERRDAANNLIAVVHRTGIAWP